MSMMQLSDIPTGIFPKGSIATIERTDDLGYGPVFTTTVYRLKKDWDASSGEPIELEPAHEFSIEKP